MVVECLLSLTCAARMPWERLAFMCTFITCLAIDRSRSSSLPQHRAWQEEEGGGEEWGRKRRRLSVSLLCCSSEDGSGAVTVALVVW